MDPSQDKESLGIILQLANTVQNIRQQQQEQQQFQKEKATLESQLSNVNRQLLQVAVQLQKNQSMQNQLYLRLQAHMTGQPSVHRSSLRCSHPSAQLPLPISILPFLQQQKQDADKIQAPASSSWAVTADIVRQLLQLNQQPAGVERNKKIRELTNCDPALKVSISDYSYTIQLPSQHLPELYRKVPSLRSRVLVFGCLEDKTQTELSSDGLSMTMCPICYSALLKETSGLPIVERSACTCGSPTNLSRKSRLLGSGCQCSPAITQDELYSWTNPLLALEQYAFLTCSSLQLLSSFLFVRPEDLDSHLQQCHGVVKQDGLAKWLGQSLLDLVHAAAGADWLAQPQQERYRRFYNSLVGQSKDRLIRVPPCAFAKENIPFVLPPSCQREKRLMPLRQVRRSVRQKTKQLKQTAPACDVSVSTLASILDKPQDDLLSYMEENAQAAHQKE